ARSIDMLVEEGLSVRVVSLPAGKDPDEIVLAGGSDAFAALLEASTPWVEFKIEAACKRIATKFASKSEIAREAMQVIAHVRDPIERDQYVKAMARRLDIDETALRHARFSAPAHGGASPPLQRANDGVAARARPRSAPDPPSVERELLQIILARPALIGAAAARVVPDDLEQERFRDAFALLLDRRDEVEHGLNPLSVFSDVESSAELAKLALAAPPMSAEEDEQRLSRVLDRFDRRRLERRLSSVDAEMNSLLTEGRTVPIALRDEYNALALRLRGLGAA